MKKLLLLSAMCFLLLGFVSCKKAIENKKEDLVVDAMTDGVWIVEQYFENSVNISNDFLNYDFQFYKDGTVKGTKAGNISNGTWTGSASTYTITSNFPGASDPVLKLNGSWKITDSYWDYVEAEMPTASGKNILHLRKKP